MSSCPIRTDAIASSISDPTRTGIHRCRKLGSKAGKGVEPVGRLLHALQHSAAVLSRAPLCQICWVSHSFCPEFCGYVRCLHVTSKQQYYCVITMATASSSLPERLRYAARRCCQDKTSEESEDAARREFIRLLEIPLYDLELRQASGASWLAQCEQVLQQAVQLLDPSASSGLAFCEKIGLELPRVVVKFVTLSQVCQDHCLSIIEDLAENCSPREMFAAFMEALHIYTASQTLVYCIPLVQGLSLVFSRLQRRQARFFQEASLGLLALMRLAAQDEEDEEDEEDSEEAEESVQAMVPLKQVRAALVDDIVQVAQVVRESCESVLVDEHREVFQQRLGMFALQILGITGEKIALPGREVPPAVLELVELLPFCGLSVFLLLTGDQIEALIETTADDDSSDDAVVKTNQKKSEATKGAALAVSWALASAQVAEAAQVSRSSLKEGLQFTGRKGVVAAVAVAASLISSGWSQHRPPSAAAAAGFALVGSILDLASSLELSSLDDDDEDDGGLAMIVRIWPALQSLQNVVVYAPKIETRRQGYAFFKRIIQDVLPETIRLQCLQTLINDCAYPSLVSLHLICIKEEVARSWPTSSGQELARTSSNSTSPFVSDEVLEVIASVLKPEDAPTPDLPTQIDPVRSALNLYRFILLRESSGKTNYTGILSKEVLRKARAEWLLPLRELLKGRQNFLQLRGEEDGEMSVDLSLAIDSLLSLVYRCLELNEDALAP